MPEDADVVIDDSKSDAESRDTDAFDEDTYGAAVTMLMRDAVKRARRRAQGKSSANSGILIGRDVLSLLLLWVNIGIQLFLLYNVKRFVSAAAVHSVRENYDEFERVLYKGHVVEIPGGHVRGVPAYFDAKEFGDLDEEVKEEACAISLSQPAFLTAILIIWTLTVLAELKRCWLLFERLLWHLPTVADMSLATESEEPYHQGAHEVVITGLTKRIKTMIGLLILLPRLMVSLVLLWLGCRWLCATADFEDLVLNSVALEFVLLLRCLLFEALVPARNKRDMQRTLMHVGHEARPTGHPTKITVLGTFTLGLVAYIWTVLYIYWFQNVLPDYRFDVSYVCQVYLAEQSQL